jgi:hypothetical protein
MSDFFGALELELRAAAERRPRRQVTVGQALGGLAAAALVAVAVAVVAAVSGGGGGDSAQVTSGPKLEAVGTVIPKGEGTPPRTSRSLVVATGRTPGIGAWQMETSRSTAIRGESGEVYQPAGLRCVSLFLVGGPPKYLFGSGQCGEFPRTPGFSRLQLAGLVLHTRSRPQARRRNRRLPRGPVLVYGRVPERATKVVVTDPNGLRLETKPHEAPKGARGDFYALAVPQHHPGARVNWLDASGRPGSRGIALLPPITR